VIIGQICFAQTISLTNYTDLAFQINESSGLEYLESSYYTHNDDTDVKLFEFDLTTGNIVREVVINSASNIDWEDLACDGDYMYIGDFGNNNGNRTNLKIYKCPIEASSGNLDNFVTPEEIKFSYAEQIDFNPGNKNHNFDAEAIISIDTALFLFTKNWVNDKTHIYQLSKTPGTYSVSKIDEIEVPGLVTAAEYIEDLNVVVLIGYTEVNGVISDNFATIVANFNNNQFSSGDIFNVDISVSGSKKTEGLVIDDAYNLYVSSEANAGYSQTLYGLNLYAVLDSFLSINDTIVNPNDTTYMDTTNTNPDDTTSILIFDQEKLVNFYPNPVDDELNIVYFDLIETHIYDLNGKCIVKSSEKQINLSMLNSGIYFLKLINKAGEIIQISKIYKNK